MATEQSFNLASYQGAPVIWGSVKDTTGLTLPYKGAPFLIENQQVGIKSVHDSLGRLSQEIYTNGTSIVYNYDNAGNRTSTVVTAGPHGL